MSDKNTISRASARRRVEQYLNHRLDALDVGQVLPPVRRIMSDCDVSQLTVQTAINYLSDQGKIDVQPRRGLFKKDGGKKSSSKVSSPVQQLDLFYCGLSRRIRQPLSSDFHADLFAQFGRVCGERGWSVRLYELSDCATAADMQEILQNNDCRAVVTVGNPVFETDVVFRDRGIACANLFPRAAKLPANSVTTDAGQIIGTQMDYLQTLGHRKIGYLHLVDEAHFHRDLMLRREQFYRYVAQHSLPFESHWVQYAGFDESTTIGAIYQMMEADNKPTAFIMSDMQLPAAYRAFGEMGLSVGKDISIIGTDDLTIAASQQPPATTLRVPRRRAVQMVMKLLDKVLESDNYSAESEVLPVELIERQSTSYFNPLKGSSFIPDAETAHKKDYVYT